MIVYDRSFREVLQGVAERARRLRMSLGLRQADLAERAGVGVATVIRFERTGGASFENVLRIARALKAEGSFERLFEMPPYASLDEALKEPEQKRPRRVRRKN